MPESPSGDYVIGCVVHVVIPQSLHISCLVPQVRDFLLAKLYQLRKPKTNISIIQQNVLLKYKYFVRFLADHGQDVYQEVRQEK